MEGSISQHWAVLPRGYSSDWFITHEKRRTRGSHLRSKPAHMPLVKYHPLRQWRKALYSHPHPISCNLWSHRIWGNSDASWPRFSTIWELEWAAWCCCHHRFHLPHSRKFITHRVILANASHSHPRGRERKTRKWVLPKTSSWLLLCATTSCKKALGWLPRPPVIWLHPARFSPLPNWSQWSLNRLLSASVLTEIAALPCYPSRGQPKSQISDKSPLIPPAHTTVPPFWPYNFVCNK